MRAGDDYTTAVDDRVRRTNGTWQLTFLVLAVAAASFMLLQSMVVPALAALQEHFDSDQATTTWVVTAYLLSASVATPLVGRIGDVIGKQKMLVFTLATLSVGSLIAALAPSIAVLVAARAVQGIGGGVMPLAFGIIRDEFAPRHQRSALAIIASLGAVGFGVGIVIAGPVVDAFGHRWLFGLPMIVTGCAALAAWLFVPESPTVDRVRLPILPGVLLATWLVMLLLSVSMGSTWGWTSIPVFGLVGGALVSGIAWVIVELRVPVPMIDMRMMKRRGVWTANFVSACVGFGMYSAFAFLPQLLQTPVEAGYGYGATITESGRYILPAAAASFAVGFVTGWLVHRFGARLVIVSGTALMAVAFCGMAFLHAEPAHIYAWTTLQGIGGGLVFSSIPGVVIASVPPAQTGAAGGVNMNIRTIGGAIGSAVMAAIVTSHADASGWPRESGYTIGFTMLSASMVIAALSAMLIPESRERAGSPGPNDVDPLAATLPSRL